MRLTYLFVRHSRYSFDHLRTDGRYELLRRLQREGLVDSVRVVRESYGVPGVHWDVREPGFESLSVHTLDDLALEPGEVVWVRGGWKPWIPWIERHLPDHWFLYYGANAGHGPWPFWDVVLEDRHDRVVWPDKAGHLTCHYRKPVHSDFRPGRKEPDVWDVCVGASHLFDRKGQYKILAVCDEYRRGTGRDLRCVVPGSFYSRERRTEDMRRRLAAGEYPNVHMAGMLPRPELVRVFQRSTFAYVPTCGGQGDRSALEAGACGCRLVLSRRPNHAPYLTENPHYCFVPSHPDATAEVAAYLAEQLVRPDGPDRQECAAYHHLRGGQIECARRLRPILDFCRARRKSDGRDQLSELAEELLRL